MERDRNLLFGILAVQLKRVSPSALVEVAGKWTHDPTQDLGSYLVAGGVLDERGKVLIDGLVDEAVRIHKGDTTATLDTFGGERQVADSFQRTLTLTASGGVTFCSQDGENLSDLPRLEEAPGRYSQISEHARGGMGRVLLVHDQYLGRDIALKELLPGKTSGFEDGEWSPVRRSMPLVVRFLQEARITGQLEHPGIVPVYELGQRVDGTVYYTMKLVRGETLSSAIKNAGNLAGRLALLSHFLDLCQAIAYAHSRSVIHRDIKPSNVMVGEFGETVVLDWGLAKVRGQEDPLLEDMAEGLRLLQAGDPASAGKTVYGHALGTPAYMSPEQAQGELDKIDERADIYSLGAVLYELLTGQSPFTGSDPLEVVNEVLSGPPATVASLVPTAPPELIAICKRAMDREPRQRYDSAKDLAEEIERFQSGALVNAYAYGFGEHIRRLVARNKAVFLTAIVAVCVLVTAGVFSYFRVVQERDRAILAGQEAEQARNAERELRIKADQKQMELASSLAETYDYQSRVWESDRFDPTRAILYACKALSFVPLNSPDVARYILRLQQLSEKTPVMVFPSFAYVGGPLLATWSHDGTTRLWDATTGRTTGEPMQFTMLSGSILLMEFSPDYRRVITMGAAGGAQLWDVAAGKPLGEQYPVSQTFIFLNSCKPIQFSLDGKRALIITHKGVLVADASTGKVESDGIVLQDLSSNASCALFSPDGRWVATGLCNQDRTASTAQVWDAATGQSVGEPMKHDGTLECLVFTPDGLRIITASSECRAHIWDSATGKPLGDAMMHDGLIEGVDVSPDGRLVATRSRDSTARVWDALTGKPVSKPMKHNGGVSSVAFSPDNQWIVTASADRTARVWDATTGEAVSKPMEHDGSVSFATFSPDGKSVATASDDRTARVWDAATGKPVSERFGHANSLSRATFSPDGRRLITSAGYSDEAVMWDAAAGKPVIEPMNANNNMWLAAVSPDGRWIAAAGKDFTVQAWNTATGQPTSFPLIHESWINSIAFSPNGRLMATASSDGTTRLWDICTGKPVGEPMKHIGKVSYVEFSRDGRWVVTASQDSTPAHKGTLATLRAGGSEPTASARVWDAVTGLAVSESMKSVGRMEDAVFSSDGRWVATSGTPARVWEVATGELSAEFTDSHADFVAFSPDGRWVATSGNGQLRVWETATGQPVGEPMDSPNTFRGPPVFSPDGRCVAASGTPARVWEAATGRLLFEFADSAEFVDFSPDGRWVATGAPGNTVRLWDASTGKSVGEPMTLDAQVRCLSFSRLGRWLMTVSADGRASVWPVGASATNVVPWMLKMGEALTAARLTTTDQMEPIKADEYMALRQSFFAELQQAAQSGDEAAKFVIRRWESEQGGAISRAISE